MSQFNQFDINETDYKKNERELESNESVLLQYEDILRVYCPTALLIDKVVTPFWYVLGITGNMTSAYIWLQRRMRNGSSSAIYLSALSISDTIFLLLHIVFELHNAWGLRTYHYPGLCEIIAVFFLVFQYLVPVLVLGFTIDRFIAVVYPFRKVVFCTVRRALWVVVGLVIACFSLGSLQAYLWQYDPTTNKCAVRVSALEGGHSSLWEIWSWLTEILIFLVVPVAALVIDIVVIVRLRARSRDLESAGVIALVRRTIPTKNGAITNRSKESTKFQRSMSISVSNNAATNVMLLTVSFYLILMTLPATLVYVIHPPQGPYDLTMAEVEHDLTWHKYLQFFSIKTIVEEICLSHYSCNILLFLATGEKFRDALLALFGKRSPAARNDTIKRMSLSSKRPSEDDC